MGKNSVPVIQAKPVSRRVTVEKAATLFQPNTTANVPAPVTRPKHYSEPLKAIMRPTDNSIQWNVSATNQSQNKSDQKKDIRSHLARVDYVELSWSRDELGHPVCLACKRKPE